MNLKMYDKTNFNIMFWAVLAAYKRAQELTYQFSGNLPKGEKNWKEICIENGLTPQQFKKISNEN